MFLLDLDNNEWLIHLRLHGRDKKERPKLQLWNNFVLMQCVKPYHRNGKRWICKGVHKVVCFLKNTTVERLNASFRSGISALIRRSRYTLKSIEKLHQWMYLYGTVYNFCTVHKSLKTTPAVNAGITQRVWSIQDLLLYKVPVQKWKPPKKRSRISNPVKELIRTWSN